MTKVSDLKRYIEVWNLFHGERFYTSTELLDSTFFSWPHEKRGIWQSDQGVVLYKIDEKVVRIHWAAGDFNQIVESSLKAISEVAHQNQKSKIIFGAGMEHLFPGVPLECGFEPWLKSMSPFGEVQSDFIGDITKLNSAPSTLSGSLRRPQNAKEKNELREMVETEFPGRWTEEFHRDEKLGFSEHYFGYYVDGSLTAYVRLYGWNQSYWAPGVYWKKAGEKLGGLGPIGVKISQRGKGLGGQLLAASWQELCNLNLDAVRVDWTTETSFYTRAGLKEVQKYQPAKLDLA